MNKEQLKNIHDVAKQFENNGSALGEMARFTAIAVDAILDLYSQHADDLCVRDHQEFFAKLGLPPQDRRVGDKFAMIGNCWRFINNECERGGPWKSYAEMEKALAQEKAFTKVLENQYQGLQKTNEENLRQLAELERKYVHIHEEACKQAADKVKAEKELVELQKIRTWLRNLPIPAGTDNAIMELVSQALSRYRNRMLENVKKVVDRLRIPHDMEMSRTDGHDYCKRDCRRCELEKILGEQT